MKAATSKRIEALMLRLEEIYGELNECQSQLESDRDEMQEAFDSKSERWQESDKGSEAQEVLNYLDSAVDELREVCDTAENCANNLRDALAQA